MNKDILVVVAHPDDEVIGMGGTISKLTKLGNRVTVMFLATDAKKANELVEDIPNVSKYKMMKESSYMLGCDFLDLGFDVLLLDKTPTFLLAKKIVSLCEKHNIRPEIVFTHDSNDRHKDHKAVNEATLLAFRPNSGIKKLYSFEIPGSSQGFDPNHFEDVTRDFFDKVEALKCYDSELKEFPGIISIQSMESLAKVRGSQIGVEKAEGFKTIFSRESVC